MSPVQSVTGVAGLYLRRCRQVASSKAQTCLTDNAAEALQERGVSAEVIDLRPLEPLDEATILASVRKTGRTVWCTKRAVLARWAPRSQLASVP